MLLLVAMAAALIAVLPATFGLDEASGGPSWVVPDAPVGAVGSRP